MHTSTGYLLDARERHGVVARLQLPDTGFRVRHDGECWTWRFQLEPLKAQLDAPSGSAVVLAAIVGIPFARLRAALPDDLLEGSLAEAVGRKQVFSRTGMAETLADQNVFRRGMGLRSRKQIEGPPKSADAAPDVEKAALDNESAPTAEAAQPAPAAMPATPLEDKIQDVSTSASEEDTSPQQKLEELVGAW